MPVTAARPDGSEASSLTPAAMTAPDNPPGDLSPDEEVQAAFKAHARAFYYIVADNTVEPKRHEKLAKQINREKIGNRYVLCWVCDIVLDGKRFLAISFLDHPDRPDEGPASETERVPSV
eukprot:scaffold15328_cov16-Prasinocladus_malaysianus.AAC.1